MRKRLFGIVLSVVCIASMLGQDIQVYASELSILEVSEPETMVEETLVEEAQEEVVEVEEPEEVVEEIIEEVPEEPADAEIIEADDEEPDPEIIEAEDAEPDFEEYEEIASGSIDAVMMTQEADSQVPDDAMLQYFEDGIFDREHVESTSYVINNLNEQERILYNNAKARVELIAQGKSSDMSMRGAAIEELYPDKIWTAKEVGVSKLNESTMYNACSSWVKKYKYPQVDFSKVYFCVLEDCAYEGYWVGLSYQMGYDSIKFKLVKDKKTGKTGIKFTGGETYLNFSASQDYAVKSGTLYYPYQLDTNKTKAVGKAINNAKNIVNEASSYSDYEKLNYYKNKICALNSYNYVAAGTAGLYGDPWQIIYVFDGNSTTNVVCEGYSKAFKYLCDMSDFASELIRCYTVTGLVDFGNGSGGNHMWNILHMDDGRNYMVDVTNCDNENGPVNNSLFLASPVRGSVDSGYIFKYKYSGVGSAEYAYYYEFTGNIEHRAKKVFTDEELTISSKPYGSGADSKEYTITFAGNGGTLDETTRLVKAGRAVGTFPMAKLKGYELVGWFTAPKGGTEVKATTVPKADQTLYAHWTKKVTKYVLLFKANGGKLSGASYKEVAKGSKYGELPTPTRSKYIFTGWYTKKSGGSKVTSKTVCKGDKTLYAHWSKKATIKFNANGGKVKEKSRKKSYGAKIGKLPTPTKKGYKFLGWYTAKDGGTKVTSKKKCKENMTLYAHWKKK